MLPLDPLVRHDTGLGTTGARLVAGLANAAYSFGCAVAAQFAQKLRGRRLLVLYACGFVTGSVLAARAPVAGLFAAGRVPQGLTTGLMLIAAVPPLVLRWPPSTLPRTAVVRNMGLFGATALGPVIGGAAAATGTWRLRFWIVAALARAPWRSRCRRSRTRSRWTATHPETRSGSRSPASAQARCSSPPPPRRRRRS